MFVRMLGVHLRSSAVILPPPLPIECGRLRVVRLVGSSTNISDIVVQFDARSWLSLARTRAALKALGSYWEGSLSFMFLSERFDLGAYPPIMGRRFRCMTSAGRSEAHQGDTQAGSGCQLRVRAGVGGRSCRAKFRGRDASRQNSGERCRERTPHFQCDLFG